MAWSLLRVLVTSVVSFVTTPILLRAFSPGDYAGWVVVASVTSFLTIVDVGLSAEVVRSAAKARTAGDTRLGFDTLKSVMVAHAILTAVMTVALAVVVQVFPNIYSEIPQDSIGRARWALIVLGLTSLAQIALNPLVAHQIGLDRIDVGAKAAIAARILALGWIFWSAPYGLAVVAAGVAVLYTVCYALAAYWAYRVTPGLRLRAPFSVANPHEPVIRFAKRRLVWFLGFFAATTFDITIIARYSYRELIPFSLALALVMTCSTAFEAVFSALIPKVPGLPNEAVAAWFVRFLFLVISSSALIVAGMGITAALAIPYWVPAATGAEVMKFLFPMLAVTHVRLVLDGLTAFMVARNEQRRCVWNHVFEAILKLSFGLVLVTRYGVIGLIWGGFIGAVVSISWALFNARIVALRPTNFKLPLLTFIGLGLLLTAVFNFIDTSSRTTQCVWLSVVAVVMAGGMIRSALWRLFVET